MRTRIFALLVILPVLTFTASADVLFGGDVDVTAWQQNSSNSSVDSGSDVNYAFDASIEHPVPLIPNIRLSQSSVDADNFQYTKQDITLYYEFLDNDLVSLDIGAGLTYLSEGQLYAQTFEGYVPHVYGAVELGLPATPLFIFAEGSGISYSDHELYDASVGVKYVVLDSLINIELLAGYRVQYMRLHGFDNLTSDLDTQTDGFYGGINIDF